MKLKITFALIAVLALAAPAGASANVTLQPEEVAAGDFAVLDVRVPNERDDAVTTKVAVQTPVGLYFPSYQPVPGWSVDVRVTKFAVPITIEGEKTRERLAGIIWTANGDKAGIQPGQFQDFPISFLVPDKAGDTLTVKALQTYDNGEVATWIGGQGSDGPAPQVTIAEGSEDGHGGASADSEEESSDDSDGASKGLGIAALILGALGLLVGGTALVRSRRTA